MKIFNACLAQIPVLNWSKLFRLKGKNFINKVLPDTHGLLLFYCRVLYCKHIKFFYMPCNAYGVERFQNGILYMSSGNTGCKEGMSYNSLLHTGTDFW